ncbi:hypothetical protein [Chitinivibrio alkaliphilus]|uniref:Uncharacterized protein n=1 Tax=Chitinivibrio alkaliphilus ACht1 TaxID=1313304 RepID=U7D624_9BACT|nr:hypothetical protein [Chitinivibrio alkaliphilus]ERP31964.1 hypothetical protein CALK_1185 [Chitinivibrio alkaliphilus ACht1]
MVRWYDAPLYYHLRSIHEELSQHIIFKATPSQKILLEVYILSISTGKPEFSKKRMAFLQKQRGSMLFGRKISEKS